MDNFKVQVTGYGSTDDDALSNAKRMALYEVIYDQSLTYTEKFVGPGELFKRADFSKTNSVDEVTGQFSEPQIDTLLALESLYGAPDVKSKTVQAEGLEIKTQLVVEFEFQTDILRTSLIENAFLRCADGSSPPCKDISSAVVPFPAVRFETEDIPEGFKGFSLYPYPWKKAADKDGFNTLKIQPGVHCSVLDSRPALVDTPKGFSYPAGAVTTNNLKKWWYKVRILEGEQFGAIGWTTAQTPDSDLLILKILTDEEINEWMQNQSLVRADDDPEPVKLFDASGKRIPLEQKTTPSLSLNPEEFPKNTTHVVRVPKDFEGLPWINMNGKAVIRTGPGVGRRVGILENNTPLEIIEPNVGKRCDWHKVRLNNTAPALALNFMTTEKINSVEDSVYIHAPYALILPKGKFAPNANDPNKLVDFIHLDHIVPTPEETQNRNSNNSSGVEKVWFKESPCAPWIQEFQSETNKDYWKSEYMVVIQLERPGVDRTVYDSWAEKVAGVDDNLTDSEKLPPEPVAPTTNDEGETTIDAFSLDKKDALGVTPEEQELTLFTAKMKGLLTLLKYYDKKFDLVSVLKKGKLPYFVRQYGWYVDPDIPGGPLKVLVGVPLRFFDAIPYQQVPFQFDYESRLDNLIEENKLEKADESETGKLAGLLGQEDEEGIGASIFNTFNEGKELTKEIERVKNRMAKGEMKIIALDNPIYEGQRIFFSSTFFIKKLEKDIRSLKRVFSFYDKKIKNAKEKRSYLFPGFSAPLDLKREMEILDEWYGQLTELLSVNDFAYRTNMPANRKDTGSPAKPSSKSAVEIGWNEKFEILYILFNGQHMRIGFNCAIQNDPFSLRRTNAFIHRLKPVLKAHFSGKSKKKPPEEWIKKNVYPAAVIIPSEIIPKDSQLQKAEETIKKLNEISAKTSEMLEKQEQIVEDDKVHQEIVKQEKNKKQDNKDKVLSPKEVARHLKVIKTIDDAYDLLLDKTGNLQPFIDEIALCLTGDVFDIEEQIFKLVLEPIFGDMINTEGDSSEGSIEKRSEAVDFLMAFFRLVSEGCLTEILSSTVRFESEAEPDPPANQEAVLENMNTPPPPDYTDVSGDAVVGDFIIKGTVGQTPPYLILAESAATGDPKHFIRSPNSEVSPQDGAQTPEKSNVPMYGSPSYNAEVIKTLENDTKVEVLGISGNGYFFEVKLKDNDQKGFVPANSIAVEKPKAIGYLKEGSQVNKLKDPNEPGKYYEDKNFCKVEVVIALAANPDKPDEAWPDVELSKNLKNVQGWLPTAFLRPISQEAKEKQNLSKILLQKGSADKQNGLFNEVFIWQLYLITDEAAGGVRDKLLPEIPKGTKQGEKLPAKYHKKNSWKYFSNAEKKGKQFGDLTEKLTKIYFEKLSEGKEKNKDFVTNADFAPAAEFFNKWNIQKFEKELTDIEEDLSLPKPLSVLGNVTYPPPGFYTGKRSKCDWKYVAVVKAATKYEIAKKKKKKSALPDLKKALNKRYLAYQTCMGRKKDRVYGERRTFLSGKDPDTEQTMLYDSYVISSANVSEECDALYKKLVDLLGGTTWPGSSEATPEQRKAFEGWSQCVSKTVKEKQKALQQAAEKDALAASEGKSQEVTAVSELYTQENNAALAADPDTLIKKDYYPIPKNIDELIVQLSTWDEWPDNVSLIHTDSKETATAVWSALRQSACSDVLSDILDQMLSELEERKPEIARAIRALIEVAITVVNANLEPPGYKPFTLPQFPLIETDDTGKEYAKLLEDAFEKVAKETILNAVKEILSVIKDVCTKPDDNAPKPDPFDLFDNDTLNKINDLAKEYGLLGETSGPSPRGNGITITPFDRASFDFSAFLRVVTAGLSPDQKCSILVGELYREDVTQYIQNRVKQFYPVYFKFFSKRENMITLFNAMSDFIDPEICEDNTLATDVSNIPDNMGFFYGECPEDRARNNRTRKLIRAGLTEEQAKEQLSGEIADKFRLLAQLQRLQDDTENVITSNNPSPCSKLNEAMKTNPSLNKMLSQTLNTVFDPIEISFNTEARQFIPTLSDPSLYEVSLQDLQFDANGDVNQDNLSEKMLVDQSGKVNTTILSKASQAGKKAARQGGANTTRNKSFAESLKTKKVFKIATGNTNNFGDPIFFKDPNSLDKEWQFTSEDSAKSYTLNYNAGALGIPPASAQMIKNPNNKELSKYLNKEVLAQEVPASEISQNFGDDIGFTVAKTLRGALFSEDTVTAPADFKSFEFNIPEVTGSALKYEAIKAYSNSDSYALTIKSFSKNLRGEVEATPPTIFKTRGRIPIGTQKYMDRINFVSSLNSTVSTRTPQQNFFAYYLSEKLLSAFGASLAEADDEANLVINSEKFSEKVKSLGVFLYGDIAERALEKTLHIIGDSKYFNLANLRKVNMTPTATDLARNCDASNIISIIDSSLLSLSDIKQNAANDFHEANDVCDISKGPGEQGPAQSASSDALVTMFIRVSLAETILNGFFAFTQYSPDSLLNEKVMKSFLFKKFKDDLLNFRLYSKFKGRALDIVQKRREAGQFIAAVSGAESLKYLFDEQIKPVSDKFKMLLGDRIKPAETKFLDSLKVLDAASRVQTTDAFGPNIEPDTALFNRFFDPEVELKNGDYSYVLDSRGDFFLEHYIKVVDHYDEEGNALLDKYIKQNDMLNHFIGGGPVSFYRDDGTRKDFLKGFVSFSDWIEFIDFIKTNEKLFLDGETKLKWSTLSKSNLYEFFSEVTIGVRLNYVLPRNTNTNHEKIYRDTINDVLNVLKNKTSTLPIGGAVSFRNKEIINKDGKTEKVFMVPLLSTEKPIQEISSFKNAFMVEDVLSASKNLKYRNLTKIFNASEVALKEQLTQTNEYSALMKYLFPIKRFATLSTLYTMMSTKATIPSKDFFITTKFLIKRAFDLHNAGNDKEYEDAWIKFLKGTAGEYNSSQRSGDEFDPFRDMMLKIILETPQLILKGVTEMTDPNIGITKKVYDGLNLVSKVGKQFIIKQIENQYKEHITPLAESVGKTVGEYAKEFTLGDFLQESGIELPDLDTDIPASIAPAISLLMLPSALPYGIGFPPPPFGPGIGPPMTPLAIPYHILGLVSDGMLGTGKQLDYNKSKNPECASAIQDVGALLPSPEEDPDEDTDVVEISEE